MEQWIKKAPKAVLHDHLDGGLRVSTLIDLANKQNYKKLPKKNPEELLKWIEPKPNKSLALNLEAWDHTIAVMQDENSLYRVTMEALEDLANDGVVYAELRFAPLVHCQKNLNPSQVVESVMNGIRDGSKKFEILAGTILCAMRQDTNSKSVVELCIKHNDIIGFDLAGPEVGFSALNHMVACNLASKNDVNLTIHADWEVPNGINEVIIDLKSKRIGHGSQIINDFEIINGEIKFKSKAARYVHKYQIPLEICPTSNIQCGAYNNMQNHSFGKLYNANFNVTINTDNRLMSNITMSEEIENVVKFFDLDQRDINKITKKTIEAGFCNENKRLSLIERI